MERPLKYAKITLEVNLFLRQERIALIDFVLNH
jgi:hypothetical protein